MCRSLRPFLNLAHLAQALAAVDEDLLQTLERLERILAAPEIPPEVIVAVVHAQETLALLSRAFEELVARIQAGGPATQSWN